MEKYHPDRGRFGQRRNGVFMVLWQEDRGRIGDKIVDRKVGRQWDISRGLPKIISARNQQKHHDSGKRRMARRKMVMEVELEKNT